MLDKMEMIGKNGRRVKLSVVVPVYNVEKYLSECLDSLLNQGLSDEEYEIVCVDDGSTDNSLSILRKYEKEHFNIRVIMQKNSGVSAARNAGIRSSCGAHLMFCDSDDALQPGSLASLLAIMQKEHVSTLNFGMQRFVSADELIPKTSQIEYKVNHHRYTTPNVCSWIYDSGIIKDNGILFNERIKYAEDTLFMCKYMNFFGEKEWIKTENKIYFYRMREGSAMRTKNKQSLAVHMESMLILAEEYKKMQQVVDRKIFNEITKRTAMSVSNVLFDAMRMENVQSKVLLNKLQNDGLYPYPLLWFTLKHVKNNRNGTIINYFKFLFPFKWYYLMMCKIYKALQKVKK